MKTDGSDCFPSTRLLAKETGLTERSVCTHIEKAVADGWLQKRQKGISGQGWKRHEYIPTTPEKALNDIQHVKEKGTESHAKGTERHDKKALNDVQSNISVNLSKNISSLCELLHSLILERRTTFKKPNLNTWEKDIKRLLKIDKRDPAEIEKVIRWCQADPFWQNNILSPKKLREKYDQLCLKMNSGTGTKRKPERFMEEGYYD